MKKDETIKEFQKIVQKRNFYVLNDSSKVFLYALIVPLIVGLVVGFISMGIAQATGFTVAEGQSILTELCN
ncbi:MAG: hypothetical protein K2K31_02805, partial [Clostridia bacterium]|nr:hypothetical protein [Clostridia bacterium]